MKPVKYIAKRFLPLLGIIMPVFCFAQVTITGRVLNQADTKPVANVSVFLNNTTIGDKTTSAGTFTIFNVKPGTYQLVVSIIGYDTYEQPIIVGHNNLQLPDITIFSKAIGLSEVTIKSHNNPHRAADYEMFKREFLGTSVRARECKILNPQVLNVEYHDTTSTLTASSDDFLELENNALGYKIKYKLSKFLLQINDITRKNVFFQGAVYFEEMKGSPSQQNSWEINRQEAYENSPMHFLRAALADKIDKEGFKVQQYAIYANPERPADSLITANIKYYKALRSLSAGQKDSLSLWTKRSKLVPTLEKLMPWALNKQDIIETTSRPGVYLLNCDNDGLYVDYSKNRRYRASDNINYVYNDYNTENTLIKFNGSNALFDGNGIIFNLGTVSFVGAWGKNRVAEFLPYDYAPLQNNLKASDDEREVAALERYLTNNPMEKAYLHFDKPYYAAGDTIYFKGYVTAGEQHKLGGLSGVLHVDLINTKNKIDQSIKLQLDSGLTHGDFALPDSLPAGNYRVRAYTQLMRNFGETAFFDKTIPIGSPKSLKIPESLVKQPVADLKPDVQFFPEGGSLVAGVRAKVALKAIGANGLGADVKGTVLDDQNNEVAKFESGHLGMGYFYITPADGKTYKAKITYANGTQDLIALPKTLAGGITLSVNNDSIPKASVRIETSADYYRQNRGKTYSLVIYSQGIATTVNCRLDSAVIKLDILKRKLHTGVAVVTLFSPGNEPLSERLLFVQNYDQLSLNTDSKDSYAKREHVSVKLNVRNRRGEPSGGNFSVAVVDEKKIGERNNNADNILTNLLLTSDLKGYVEQPDYYFTDTSTVARQNLDLLMLTQGYRRFEWKKVLDSAVQAKPQYLSEDGLSVAGQVKNISNKPVAGGAINLFQPIGGLLLSTRTDDKGLFRFTNLAFTDTAHLVLSAVKANGKNSTQISLLDENTERPVVQSYKWQSTHLFNDSTMASYVANDKLEQTEVLNYLTGKGVMLKQVNIRDKKPDDKYETSNLLGAGHADQILHHEDVRYGTTLAGALLGRLHGIKFAGADNPGGGVPILIGTGIMQVIVDGVYYLPGSGINLVNPNDVETVEVLKYGDAAIYGGAGGHGVMIITTRRGGGLDIKDVVSSGVLPINLVGFHKTRVFYSPRYEHANAITRRPDLRSTIYWDPDLKTDENGNAAFDFYNADGAGNYKVTIEGIDKDGNIGRQVYFYEVK